MSKLGKFLGKAEEVQIQGETLKIYPLKVKDLELFAGQENATKEEQMRLSKELIKKSLKDEELTDEEIDNWKTEAFTEVMDAINKVNGFKDEGIDKIRKIKENTS